MKHIVLIHLLNDYSGSPKVLSQVIKAVQFKNVKVALYTGNCTSGFLSNTTEKHHFFIYKRFENRYFTLVSFLFSQLILFFKLLKYWRKDVDIYVNTMLPFGAGLAGWVMGKSVIYHVHEICLTPPGLKSFLRKVIQLTAKKIIFVSQSVMEHESFNNKEQVVIYNVLPQTFFETGSSHSYAQFKTGIFNVLMISSMKAYKGVFELIEIAKKLLSKKEITITLVLNASQSDIDVFFNDVALPSNITLINQQTNVIPFYENASLVLNLSRPDQWIETFGLTILEALSFGIPVIVPPVGGPSEIVADGKEGYLMSSYEIDAIAKKIEYLFNNPEKCMELSNNAKLRAHYFNEENFNTAMIQFLHV